MAKFRKKPVVIEAVQFNGSRYGFAAIIDWAGDAGFGMMMDSGRRVVLIPTLEGTMEASAGDWIIRGVKGELYPCKPDIFEATYDVVEEYVRPEPTSMPGPGESG